MNGLNKKYGAQRSQLLLQNPLPNVDVAFSVIQQEETQKDILQASLQADETEQSALFSKKEQHVDVCDACGRKGHPKDKCWTVIGYPAWHSKSKQNQKNKSGKGFYNNNQSRNTNNRWKGAANLADTEDKGENVVMSSQQFEQFMRSFGKTGFGSPTSHNDESDDLDPSFAGLSY